MKNYLQLNFSLLYWIFVAPFTGQFFKIAPIFRQMVFIGVRAAPMVALTAFSVGVTLAMQAAHSLESLGRRNVHSRSGDDHAAAGNGTGFDRGDCYRPQRFGRRGGAGH